MSEEADIHNYDIELLNRRTRKALTAMAVCMVLAVSLVTYNWTVHAQHAIDARFLNEQLLSYELDPFWTQLAQEEQTANSSAVIKEGEHAISRQELGRMGWTLLHMVTGSYPSTVSPLLQRKFNAFLVLFGQLYPCKMCALHFTGLLKQVGPFQGTTKVQLMEYVCGLHNRVNARLGKAQHDCKLVYNEWNSCGCSEGQ